jgi:hypothetical protein
MSEHTTTQRRRPFQFGLWTLLCITWLVAIVLANPPLAVAGIIIASFPLTYVLLRRAGIPMVIAFLLVVVIFAYLFAWLCIPQVSFIDEQAIFHC